MERDDTIKTILATIGSRLSSPHPRIITVAIQIDGVGAVEFPAPHLPHMIFYRARGGSEFEKYGLDMREDGVDCVDGTDGIYHRFRLASQLTERMRFTDIKGAQIGHLPADEQARLVLMAKMIVALNEVDAYQTISGSPANRRFIVSWVK